MTTKTQPPTWNKYDNIWEIRQTSNLKIRLNEILTKKSSLAGSSIGQRIGQKAFLYDNVEDFICCLAEEKKVSMPLWKVICPDLEGSSGAIYYIARAMLDRSMLKEIHVFRGTYGYTGSGCVESALVEEYCTRKGMWFEVRSGDYLLTILELI